MPTNLTANQKSAETHMRPLASGEDWWFSRGASIPPAAPLDTFLFKIASRCNLACPYCYIYELRDQGWRSQPTFMQWETYKTALARIREHIVGHRVPTISVIFHGGEPLLAGAERLEDMVSEARDQLGKLAEIHFGLQTNGTLFDESFLDVAIRNEIRVGLSVDGPPHHQDRFRFYQGGKGSSVPVEKTARLLCTHPQVFGGILCVVNLEIEPTEVWDYLAAFHPKSIDLLLPLANHDSLPPGTSSPDEVLRYGKWLVRFAELWYRSAEDRPDVRFFTSIMRLLLGHHSLVESIGLGLITLIVIESNGDLEAVDSLKSCYQGAASIGLNVFDHPLDDALRAPAVISRQMGVSALCETCRNCRFVNVCGSGYQPHRYSASRGFQNPSVYCESLQLLISRIATLMKDELPLLKLPLQAPVETIADAKSRNQKV
jgi:uncharacterized protein